MDLVVIGAGGRTGRLVVDQALAGGHRVTAYVRRPEVVTVRHDRLAVVRGDVLDPGGVMDVIADKDAVVSTLGVKGRSTTTVFSEGITNVVRAMEAKGVRRVLTVSSAGLSIGPHMPLPQRLVAGYIIERILRNIYLDLARMEDELEVSDTDWTVVRAPLLADRPASGQYRVAVDGHLTRPGRISRADLAGCIVSRIADYDTFRKRVEISY